MTPIEQLDEKIAEWRLQYDNCLEALKKARTELEHRSAVLSGLTIARGLIAPEMGNGAQPVAPKAKAKSGACKAEIVTLLKGSPASLADIEFGCPAFTPEQIRPVLRKAVAGGDIVLDEANGTYRLLMPAKARGDEALV